MAIYESSKCDTLCQKSSNKASKRSRKIHQSMQEKCNNRIVKVFQYVGASSSKGRQGKVPVSFLQLGRLHKVLKLPIAEIIWVKNVRAIVVCGFLMKFLKKHILKI